MSPSRRQCLKLLGAAGGAGLGGCTRFDGRAVDFANGTPSPVGGPHSWPMFQYDRFNSGHSDTTGPTGDVTTQWRRPDLLPKGRDYRLPPAGSPPAVVDDTVFFNSWNNYVYALSAADGSTQWGFPTGERAFSAPAVVDGTVYVGSWNKHDSDHATHGNVYALSAADGSVQWHSELNGKVTMSPVVADGTVYIGSYTTVYALSAADGTEEWSVQTGTVTPERQHSISPLSPAVADGTVYVGTGVVKVKKTEHPDCVGRGCRGPHWEGVTDHPDALSLVALSADDGEVQWRYRTGRKVHTSPVVADGTVYALANRNYQLHAVSAADGTEEWTTEVQGAAASPAVVDGTLYVGGEGGKAPVYALSGADGSEQWRTDLPDVHQVRFSPAVADGTVYAVSDPYEDYCKMYALSAADGSRQWRVEFDAQMPLPSPAVVDGTVLLGTVAIR